VVYTCRSRVTRNKTKYNRYGVYPQTAHGWVLYYYFVVRAAVLLMLLYYTIYHVVALSRTWFTTDSERLCSHVAYSHDIIILCYTYILARNCVFTECERFREIIPRFVDAYLCRIRITVISLQCSFADFRKEQIARLYILS